MSLRNVFLTSAAAFITLSAPAFAAPTVIGTGVSVPVNQPQQQADGATTQIRLDDGSIISFVGEADYTITDTGEIVIRSGNVTVLSGSLPLTIRMDGTVVMVEGGAALAVTDAGLTSHVLGGTTRVSTNGETRTFNTGQAWQVRGNDISRIIAAGPQAVAGVSNLRTTGVSGAALNGIPVVLGDALAALGASSDIVAAARQFDAVQQGLADVSTPALPGNLETLLELQSLLAARLAVLGGFNGSSPAIIDSYLRFLAGGGQVAEFQSAYLALITTYLDLLTAGGFAGDFAGLSAADIQTYLDYLESIGGLGQLGGNQQALITEYLAFLRAGGNPNDFIFSAVQLDPTLVALYQTSLDGFINFIRGGGQPADFTAIDQATLVRYILLLSSAGQLEALFGPQADVLRTYADFVAAGGAPNDFSRIDEFGLSDALIADYTLALQSFLDFLFNGGMIANFDGDPVALTTFISQLEQAGALQTALPTQRTVLLAFVQFIEAGNAASDFRGFLALGLSDTVVQAYTATINIFVQFVIDGGDIANFDGDLSAVLSNLADLQAAGAFNTAFDQAVRDALVAFQAFIADGNAAADFTGFEPLVDTGDGGDGTTTPPTPGSYTYSGGFVENTDVRTFAGFQGYRNGADVDIDDDGALLTAGTNIVVGNIYISRGSATNAEVYGDEYALIGRFTDGEAILNFAPLEIPVNGGLHWASVQPITGTMPTTGRIVYDLLAATSPTFTDGRTEPGVFDGEVTLGFATSGFDFGLSGSLVMPESGGDVTYMFETEGYSDGSLIDGGNVSGNLTSGLSYFADFTSGNGEVCNAGSISCAFTFYLVGAGPEVNRVVIDYLTEQRRLQGSRLVSGIGVSGAAMFGAPGTYTSGGNDGGSFDYQDGLAVAYAGQDVGLDFRPGARVAFDASGRPIAYNVGEDERPDIGSATIAEGGSAADGAIGWARWANGTTGGRYYSTTDGFVLGPNDGFHIVSVAPLTDVPTAGTVNYQLAGATSPTVRDGSLTPGSFQGEMAINFGTIVTADFDFDVSIDDATYGFGATGRTVGTNGLFFANNMAVSGSGSVCPTATCLAQLRGVLGGPGANAVGVSYNFAESDVQNLRTYGAAAFTAVADTGGSSVEGTARSDQFVVYSSNEIGIDAREPAIVTYDDTTGAPIAYTWNLNDFTRDNESPEIGTATQREAGSVQNVIGWARWAGGTTSGDFYSSDPGVVLPENAGWHVLAGTPATNIPTLGTVSYNLIGNTNPTIRDGSVAPGTLDTARAAVAFGTVARVGMELGLTVGGESYSISSVGGVGDLSQGMEISADEAGRNVRFGGNGLNGTLTASGGSLCDGSTAGCNATLNGFLAGEGASHMGVSYTLGNTGFDNQIDGVAAFAAQGSGGSSTAQSVSHEPSAAQDWSRWSGPAAPLPRGHDDAQATYSGVRQITPTVPEWIRYER